MMRFVMPFILISISVTVFFVFANPLYNDINKLRMRVASFNEALDNSKELKENRDTLTYKKSTIEPDDLTKLEKLLPDNIDNIRLILEIKEIARNPFGMVLKDVRYSTTDEKSATPASTGGVKGGGGVAKTTSKDYGVWDLEFSTAGSYSNFLNFTKALEKNLRIVDISSIQFSSTTAGVSNPSLPESYKYSYKIKTYWLKN